MRRALIIAAIVGLAAFVAILLVRARGAADDRNAAESSAAGAAASDADPVRAAEQLFERGAYADGRKLLVDASAEKRRDHGEYARLLLALARFYERYVGDYRRVAGYLREVENLRLGPDDPAREQVRSLRARLEAFESDYRAENAILARAASYESDPRSLRGRIDELTALAAARPDYPRLGPVYHYLGESYMQLKEHRRAHQSFSRALELRPALEFSLPSRRRQAEALEQWARRDLARGTRAALAGLLVLVGVLFVRSRPWRWLGVRHALALAALLGAWWLLFRLLVWLLAGAIPEDLTNLPPPAYVHTGLGTPMSGPLQQLLGAGLWAVGGAFVVALVASRYRPRWTAAVSGGVVTLLFVACTMTGFALAQHTARFQVDEAGRYGYLRGAFLYPLSSGQEPYFLTDPTRYCGFQANIVNLDEPEVRQWFQRFAPLCR